MRIARSASAYGLLGATLTAVLLPSLASAGISQNGVQGISQNGVQGISQNGVQGISQNGVQGISQNGVQGISQNGVQGISQNGSQGISQNGSQGISQNGGQGISQNGGQGISQNGILGISQNGVQGISQNGVLSGPIDSIDFVNNTFESMGQIVMASPAMLRGLSKGDYVHVGGSVIGAGWLYADEVVVSPDAYVPGASPVFVTGMLTSIDSLNGTAQMGGLTIDYTPSLSRGEMPAGLTWQFSGIQPVIEGALVSDQVFAR